MLKVGFIGWRGMVGSVLMGRMREEGDFQGFEPLFFSTSNVGGNGPEIGCQIPPLQDAYDIHALAGLDLILTCQGGDYTRRVYPELRRQGWRGYWIDSASTLRMQPDSIIVLDPVNQQVMESGLASGIKTYVGGNCTVSLMLMALAGLLAADAVAWISSMTYQAASGAGANNMKELAAQMAFLGDLTQEMLRDPACSAIRLDEEITRAMRGEAIPKEHFQVPLAGSLVPWIDSAMENGQTREEWKGSAETNKILATDDPIPVDGICVRVGAMRCHSQALTIKLKRDIPLEDVADLIRNGNPWVRLIDNDREATVQGLTPAAVNGTLSVPVGRLRKMLMGPEFVAAFTVGDQLLWGAAEPIRRAFRIILEHLSG